MNEIFLIAQTETIPGIFWDYANEKLSQKIAYLKKRDSSKSFQILTNSLQKAIKMWQVLPNQKMLDKWLTGKLTLIINDIGIKYTKNLWLTDYFKKFNFLKGTSINISNQTPIINKLLIKDFIKEEWYNIYKQVIFEPRDFYSEGESEVYKLVDTKYIKIR